MIVAFEHTLLRAVVSRIELPASLGSLPALPQLRPLLSLATVPETLRSPERKKAVRNLLRLGGHTPTGQGKPSCEYLIKACERGFLNPINPVVDACNAVSLHHGLPISVIDLELAYPPLVIRLGEPEESYVFNTSGHKIRLKGLLTVCDQKGPIANPVRDSQRTKTHDGTRVVLSLIWGSVELEEEAQAAQLAFERALAPTGAVFTAIAVGAAQAL